MKVETVNSALAALPVSDYNVICLQETKLITPAKRRKCLLNIAGTQDIHASLLNVVPGESDARLAKGGSVTVYTQLESPISHCLFQDNNLVVTKCNFKGITVYVVNVYIPTTVRDANDMCHNVTYKLHVLLGEKGVRNLVVCGDFNATGAKILTTWLRAHGFTLANDDNAPTHARGNVLDFVCTTLGSKFICALCGPSHEYTITHHFQVHQSGLPCPAWDKLLPFTFFPQRKGLDWFVSFAEDVQALQAQISKLQQ